MRTSLVCFSSLGILAASTAGCSSENTTPGNDSGSEVGATTDAAAMTDAVATMDAPADASTTDSAANGDGPTDSSACVPVDANVATTSAGTLLGCYQMACATEVRACAADCICNDAIVGAVTCTAAGGDPTTCFTSALIQTQSETQVFNVIMCLRLNMGRCSSAGGAEAGTEGGAEGGGSDGAADGGNEGGVADAPSGG